MNAEIKVFGVPHVAETLRKTVVAVIFDKVSKQFLYTDWPQYGLCCLLSGGIEEWESPYEALVREIAEESWYYNYSIIGQLWGEIETHYYMSTKKEYRAKSITSYLVVLEDLAKTNECLEEDEKFVLNFASYEELLELMRWYKNIDGGGLEDHIEILKRGQESLTALTSL